MSPLESWGAPSTMTTNKKASTISFFYYFSIFGVAWVADSLAIHIPKHPVKAPIHTETRPL